MLHRSDVLANSHGGGHQHGVCSDENSQQAGGGTTNSTGDTIGGNRLHGYQVTGMDRGPRKKPANAQVSFETIWPGW